MRADLYAVVEHRPWSGPDDGNVTFRDGLDDARELAGELTAAESAIRPSSYVVYRLERVEEDEN